MSQTYAIRIHELDETIRHKLGSFLDSISGSYVIARETYECMRPHFQGWIRTETLIPALRERLYRAMPEIRGRGKGRGNAVYSLSHVRDIDRYQYYILKGSPTELPDIIFRSGVALSSDDITVMHKKYWESKTETTSNAKRNTTQTLIDWVKEQSFDDMQEYQVRQIIGDKIIAEYIRTEKLMMTHQMSGVYNLCMCMASESFKREFHAKLIGNI